MSNNASVVACRSIRKRNQEERWNREMMLGILGNPWSLQDGRVEADHNPAAPAISSDGEHGDSGRADSDANQERREWQTHLHHEEDGV